MLPRAAEPGYRGVASGEQKPRAWRLGKEGVEVDLAPDVIDHDEGGFFCDRGPVQSLWSNGFISCAPEQARYLAQFRGQVMCGFPPHGDPHKARETPAGRLRP
jgi:hypothetical protein